jgi:hypothetical protein
VQKESTLPSPEQTHLVVIDDSPSGLEEPPPERNTPQIKTILASLSAGDVRFTQFKGCYIPDSMEGDASKGRFLYAWNDTATVGLVLSIHHLSIADLPVGTVKTLSVTERDAFVMIEIGDRVDTNFCVPSLKQIPISTVLESQTGSVQIKRTEVGVEASIGTILFHDQYTKEVVSFNGLTIPAQELYRPRVP